MITPSLQSGRVDRLIAWSSGSTNSFPCIAKPDRNYGGPVAEVGYTYTHEGEYFSGVHRKPFLLRSSAENYAAQFPASSDVIIRAKTANPQVSIVCDEDQAPGRRPGHK